MTVMTVPVSHTVYANHFHGTRVLVTGGAGFIGSHLAHALVQLGSTVVILDDLSGGCRENMAAIGAVEFIEGSLLDRPALARAMRGCRYVFHQAALGSVPVSVEKPRAFHEVNSTGTLNVLEAAKEAGVQRIMFAASSSVYGNHPVPWVETMAVRPQSPYAATKAAGEALLRAYSESFGIDTVSLRYFNIFGPRQNPNSAYAAVIASFAMALLAGQRPVIYGAGTQSRDFTFVDNAVHANLLAASRESSLRGEVINVGCGHPVTVNELATTMAEAMGRPELTAIYQARRVGDLAHSYADLKKAREWLGYEPRVNFEIGLRRTMEWYGGRLV